MALTAGIAASLVNYAYMKPDLEKALGVGVTSVVLSVLGSQLKLFRLPEASKGLEDLGRISKQVGFLISEIYEHLAGLVRRSQNPASLANAEMILSAVERVREVLTEQVNAENAIRLKIGAETNWALSISIAIWGLAWLTSVATMIVVVADGLSLLIFVAATSRGAFDLIRGNLVDDPLH